MKTVTVRAIWDDDNQTLGTCVITDELSRPIFAAVSLERGWLDNRANISRVPAGIYPARFEYSPKFKRKLWELKSVPDRTEVKFHAANFWRQLNGCIALGQTATDIDADGYLDVSSSRATMTLFHKVLENESEIRVVIE